MAQWKKSESGIYFEKEYASGEKASILKCADGTYSMSIGYAEGSGSIFVQWTRHYTCKSLASAKRAADVLAPDRKVNRT